MNIPTIVYELLNWGNIVSNIKISIIYDNKIC